MHKDNLIVAKSYAFAIRVVNANQYLRRSKREFIISKQLLRSGTSIGALVYESKFAQSKADFINKLSIALKEANETQYWIMLLRDTEILEQNQATSLLGDVKELTAILVTIIKSLKDS